MREAAHPRCVWDNFPTASAESRLLNYLYDQIRVIPLKGRGDSQSHARCLRVLFTHDWVGGSFTPGRKNLGQGSHAPI